MTAPKASISMKRFISSVTLLSRSGVTLWTLRSGRPWCNFRKPRGVEPLPSARGLVAHEDDDVVTPGLDRRGRTLGRAIRLESTT